MLADDVTLLHGDCLAVLPTLDADSIDAVVTDPPYGLGFMGKDWDHGVPGEAFWREALRVAKPGAHLVAFGGTRTHHRLTCAIEDAGWEIRDCLMWLYGSGFPKSLDVGKAIDKAAGAERERIRGVRSGVVGGTYAGDAWSREFKDSVLSAEPLTDAARQWDGWGTALKPAWEPIILARKPLAGTVAQNVQQWGTGAINVDGCRIGTETTTTTIKNLSGAHGNQFGASGVTYPKVGEKVNPPGRWPANLLLDEESAALLDAQTGERGAASPVRGTESSRASVGAITGARERVPGAFHGDSGGASRFFYCAKASPHDRHEGCEALPERPQDPTREAGAPGGDNPRYRGAAARANSHPTVKPTDLMRWLVRLVTPPGGLVLDPFMGSGSTGKAARLEGLRFVGIDREAAYVEIARARIAAVAPETPAADTAQPSLFDMPA